MELPYDGRVGRARGTNVTFFDSFASYRQDSEIHLEIEAAGTPIPHDLQG